LELQFCWWDHCCPDPAEEEAKQLAYKHHNILLLKIFRSEAVSKKRFILLKHSKASQVDSMPALKALFMDIDGVAAVGGAPCADA